MAEYKLTYFNVRGLAEPSRLLFALAKVPYEDIRIPYTYGQTNEIPPEIKQKLTWGQVPFLEFGDVKVAQSSAISRFLARKFNFYGANDVESAKIDEIVDAVKDYAETFRPLSTAKDEEAKAAILKNINEVVTPKYVGKFNEILAKNGTGFFVGKSVSLADVQVFAFFSNIEALTDKNFSKDYPAVVEFTKKVSNIPEIKEWVENRPKTMF